MKKILVVEDNELNMKLFYDILTYQNYSVEKSYDGLDAYNKLKVNKYDLVILDIQLPKMDGFSVVKNLKEEDIRLPSVIAVSACAMDCDKSRAKEIGIDTYLTKPIDVSGFVTTVKNHLNKTF